MLDELGIPHLIFVNRIDQAHGRIRDLLSALQPMSVSPLIARQIPIRDGEKVTGFVDLALERAFHYRPGQAVRADRDSRRAAEREAEARTQMLEQLADHDDELLEQLLMDEAPEPRARSSPTWRARPARISACRCCSARRSSGWGVRRLLKALRHEAPGPEAAASRLGVDATRRCTCSRSSTAARSAGWRSARALGGAIDEGTDLKSADGEHGAPRRPVHGAGREDRQDRQAPTMATSSRSPRSMSVKAGEWLGARQAAAADRGRLSRRATARSRSSPPTARTTSGCRARCSGCSRRIASLILEHDEASHEMRLQGRQRRASEHRRWPG